MTLPANLNQHQRSAWRVAMLAWFALIVLGLAWELWISPLRSGGSWLALKVAPLVCWQHPCCAQALMRYNSRSCWF